MIAAMIDGVWLRAALSGWREADSESARAMLTAFVDGRLRRRRRAGRVFPASRRRQARARAARPAVRAAGPAAGEKFASINPATGEVLGYVTAAGSAQVNAAVRAAQKAQAGWGALTGTERARVLRRAADILRSRNQELAELETRDTGKPIQETRVVDVASGADCFEYFAGLAQSLSGEHIDLGTGAFGYTRREPLGVVAGIGAWNYPLQIACWKAAPALACGNAMMFKPAELTPFTAVKLQEILLEAGVPPGLFQVLQGFRRHRPPPDAPSRHSQGLAHRRGRHGQGRHERCGANAEERHSGIGRQIAAHRFRRRQARQCGLRSAAGEFLLLRAGVLERHPGVRASLHQGGLSRAAGQARRTRCESAIRWIPRLRSAPWCPNSTCTRCSLI